MYTDFLRDPKLLSLAFEDQRHFIAVLALKSDGTLDNGASGALLDRMVAQFIWVDHSAIHEVKRRLMDAELLDEDWQPLGWDKRQFVSDHDPSGAERQRRHREKKRNALRNGDDNAAVTLPDTDTDTDTESDKNPPNPPGGDFAEFWSRYPKRVGKGAAEKAWGKLKAPDRDAALDDLSKRPDNDPQWLKESGRFVPNPSTYLNQKRWCDDWQHARASPYSETTRVNIESLRDWANGTH